MSLIDRLRRSRTPHKTSCRRTRTRGKANRVVEFDSFGGRSDKITRLSLYIQSMALNQVSSSTSLLFSCNIAHHGVQGLGVVGSAVIHKHEGGCQMDSAHSACIVLYVARTATTYRNSSWIRSPQPSTTGKPAANVVRAFMRSCLGAAPSASL